MHAAGTGTAGVGTVAEYAVITGGAVIWMQTDSRTVTGIIRTFIPVITTRRA